MDAAIGGSFTKKYIEDMAKSNVNWHSEHQNNKRPSWVFRVEVFATITSQLDAMNKKIEALAISPSHPPSIEQYELCWRLHTYIECLQGNTNMKIFESAIYITGNFRTNMVIPTI